MKVYRCWQLWASQIRMSLLQLPEARYMPSQERAMQMLWLLWPEGCRWVPHLAQRITHSFHPTLYTLQSLEAEKMARASGVITKHVMESSNGGGSWGLDLLCHRFLQPASRLNHVLLQVLHPRVLLKCTCFSLLLLLPELFKVEFG